MVYHRQHKVSWLISVDHGENSTRRSVIGGNILNVGEFELDFVL